jgi:hypothetical protein
MFDTILDKINSDVVYYQQQAIDANIFSWTELECLLNLRPFVNHKRFHIVNDKNYTWHNPGWSSDNGYPPSLIQEEIKHYVCYLSDCSKVNKSINDLCKLIEDQTGSEVDAHVYFSFSYQDQDIEKYIHKDKSNNLIIQIDGETSFKVWDKERTNLLYDIVMRPGDVLYIPAGYWHGALSLSRRLSISIPVSPYQVELREDRHWIQLQ